MTVEWETAEGCLGATPMDRLDDLWRAFVREAGTATRYAYRLDDEGPFPDPYARALPEGVHGRAEVVDPAAFVWHDAGWPGLCADGLVVYELHVGACTGEGTFDAAIAELPRLVDLGVTAIELMPVASFPGRWNWGYDAVAAFAPAELYGGPEGLRRLVDAAHHHGLGVILDVVYNHLGPSGNYLRAFSPSYFTDRHQTPWGDAIDYDGRHSRRVRDWAIDSAVHWLVEYHADGLRLDATAEIKDGSRVHLLREMSACCRAAVDRPIVLIAEDNRNDVRLVRPPPRGHGLDAIWADDFHHALRTTLTGQREGYYRDYSGRTSDVVEALRHGFVYRGRHSSHLGRRRGRPTGDTPARAFVFCTENHDQVGNRALGERLSHLVSPAAYRAASALLLLAAQTPMLFMGQEMASAPPFLFFTDHEPEIGKLVTAGRRAEFAAFSSFAEHPEHVPDPQAEETFRRSNLDLADRDPNAGVYRLYRDLLARRKADPTLRAQDRLGLRAVTLGPRALALTLGAGEDRRMVVANFGRRRLDRPMPAGLGEGRWRAEVSSDNVTYGGDGRPADLGDGRVRISAETTVLFHPASGR